MAKKKAVKKMTMKAYENTAAEKKETGTKEGSKKDVSTDRNALNKINKSNLLKKLKAGL